MRGYTVRTLFFRVLSTSLSLCLSFFITKTYIKSTLLRNNFKSFTLTHFLSLSFFDSVPQFVCLFFFRSPCLSVFLSFALPICLSFFLPLSPSPHLLLFLSLFLPVSPSNFPCLPDSPCLSLSVPLSLSHLTSIMALRTTDYLSLKLHVTST